MSALGLYKIASWPFMLTLMELFKIGFFSVNLTDLVDIAIVSFLIYKLYDILKGSLAVRVMWVILAIVLLSKVVEALDLVLLDTILRQFAGLGAIGLVVIFAPEIRRFLLAMSKNTALDRFLGQVHGGSEAMIQEISIAVKNMKTYSHGALIVLCGPNPLVEVRKSGEQLSARVSARLIQAIFHTNSALHDGAVIIYEGKIDAAGCILPLSQSTELPPDMGLRHRSALGMAERSDALVIIVSEERGEVSLAQRGKLRRNVTIPELIEALRSHYQTEMAQNQKS